MAWLIRKLYSKLMTPYMEVEQEYDKDFSPMKNVWDVKSAPRYAQHKTLQFRKSALFGIIIVMVVWLVLPTVRPSQFKTPEGYENMKN